MKAQRLEYKIGEVIIVFSYNKTRNNKICSNPNEKILQTFSFTREQFELANIGHKITMNEFFKADSLVCLDCPFSANVNGKAGKCYTHKFSQYMGFLSTLRSIGRNKTFNDIEDLPMETPKELLKLSTSYIRFGSYGEPSLIPYNIVSEMVAICKSSGNNWTGYSHQMHRTPKYNSYFMNSAHENSVEGLRSFVVTNSLVDDKGTINCPASAEMSKQAACNTCGLCSGTEGKGKKDVVIIDHA